jgi:hypothetical protein
MNTRTGFALAAIVLSACGGGGNGNSVLEGAGPAASSAPRADVTFTLVLPTRETAETANRGPRYVSPSTLSAVVTLTALNGTPVPSPQPYAVSIDYTIGCSVPSSVRRSPQTQLPPTKVCSFSLPATVGVDTFEVDTYDAAQSSSTPTSLAGNLLSTGTTTTTVLANTANTTTVTLDGVIATLSLSLANRSYPSSTSQTLFVVAKDADGNTIVGPGNYTTPITLAATYRAYHSGRIVFSMNSVTSPSTVVTISYTNACGEANFTASAPNAPPYTTATTQTPWYFAWGEC